MGPRFAGNLIITSTLWCATNDAQNTSLQWNSILRNSLLHLLLLFCKVTKNQRNRWNVSLSWYVKTSQDRLVKIFSPGSSNLLKTFLHKRFDFEWNFEFVLCYLNCFGNLFVAQCGSIIFGYVRFNLNYRIIYIYSLHRQWRSRLRFMIILLGLW